MNSQIFFSSVSEVWRRQFVQRQGLEGKKVILVCGRVEPHKNREGTLRVFEKVRQKRIDAVLLKVGIPFNRSQLQGIEEHGLKSHTRVTGMLPEEELVLASKPVMRCFSFPVRRVWISGFGSDGRRGSRDRFKLWKPSGNCR